MDAATFGRNRHDIWPRSWYHWAMATIHNPTNGKRNRSTSATITTDPITFHNHIDWRSMRTDAPINTYGRWAFSPWQTALRAVVAARHSVTVDATVGDMAYHRAARLTGTRPAIDAMMDEYNTEHARILARARITYLDACDAERNGDDATVARLNPAYVVSWEPFYNAFGIGAVNAYAVLHGVTVAIRESRSAQTSAVGATMYPPAVAPKRAKRANAAKRRQPTLNAAQTATMTDAERSAHDAANAANVDASTATA